MFQAGINFNGDNKEGLLVWGLVGTVTMDATPGAEASKGGGQCDQPILYLTGVRQARLDPMELPAHLHDQLMPYHSPDVALNVGTTAPG